MGLYFVTCVDTSHGTWFAHSSMTVQKMSYTAPLCSKILVGALWALGRGCVCVWQGVGGEVKGGMERGLGWGGRSTWVQPDKRLLTSFWFSSYFCLNPVKTNRILWQPHRLYPKQLLVTKLMYANGLKISCEILPVIPTFAADLLKFGFFFIFNHVEQTPIELVLWLTMIMWWWHDPGWSTYSKSVCRFTM